MVFLFWLWAGLTDLDMAGRLEGDGHALRPVGADAGKGRELGCACLPGVDLSAWPTAGGAVPRNGGAIAVRAQQDWWRMSGLFRGVFFFFAKVWFNRLAGK